MAQKGAVRELARPMVDDTLGRRQRMHPHILDMLTEIEHYEATSRSLVVLEQRRLADGCSVN